MLRNGKYEINGEYYLFDTDGIMYAGNLGIEFYDFKSNTYAVRTDGTLVSGKCGKIDGKEYYFDKTGIMQKNKIIRIGKNNTILIKMEKWFIIVHLNYMVRSIIVTQKV